MTSLLYRLTHLKGTPPMTTLTQPRSYVHPGLPGSLVDVKPRYDNFIGGRWVAPTQGKYTTDLNPSTGLAITQVPLSTVEDVELALDAAHAAKEHWGKTSVTERAKVLNAIADAMEQHLEMLAIAES